MDSGPAFLRLVFVLLVFFLRCRPFWSLAFLFFAEEFALLAVVALGEERWLYGDSRSNAVPAPPPGEYGGRLDLEREWSIFYVNPTSHYGYAQSTFDKGDNGTLWHRHRGGSALRCALPDKSTKYFTILNQ